MHVPKPVSTVVSIAAALLFAACGPPEAATAVSSEAISTSAVAPGNAGGNKFVDVMTRNLYLGADLAPVVLAQDLPTFLAATTAVWNTVLANNVGFGEDDVLARLDGVADEIAAGAPDLVGLQEVYLWEATAPLGTDFEVAFDYLAVLLAKLAERGAAYEPAVVLPLFSIEAPVLTGETIRTTDRQVILARRTPGLHVSNPRSDVFGPDGCAADASCVQLLHLQILGQPVAILRGWTSVDVRYRGETFRFVNTHLESFNGLIRTAQAVELAAVLEDAEPRAVLVGDLNSAPGTEGHLVMTSAGFRDAWTALHPEPASPGDEGWTCCFPELLTESGPLDERIDLVLARGPVVPVLAGVVGDEEGDRIAVGELLYWPSDHAGVLARLRLVDERFFALSR